MGNPVSTNGVTLTLVDFKKFNNANIDAQYRATGPLVNISGAEGGSATPYTVTVLAYIPSNQQLKPVDNTSGLSLQGNQIYLNYYGATNMQILNKQGGWDTVSCRDFRVEFNCNEQASQYDLYYIQFTYQLDSGTPSVDAICVRDQDDDPETDRGTVTRPSTPPPTL
ncbi:hypothetical protein [Tenacibaculum skagerrakense]|nr:hypothetical protein [Tenacibaculum skagerrakense]